MGRRRSYLSEVRERVARLVPEVQGEYPTQWEAITSIAAKIGCSGEALRNWVRQAEGTPACVPG